MRAYCFDASWRSDSAVDLDELRSCVSFKRFMLMTWKIKLMHISVLVGILFFSGCFPEAGPESFKAAAKHVAAAAEPSNMSSFVFGGNKKWAETEARPRSLLLPPRPYVSKPHSWSSSS